MKRLKKYKRKFIKTSKLETRFGGLLKKWGILYKKQYKVGTKYYDFYLPKYNLLLEIDGDFWHANPKKFQKLSLMQVKNKQNDIYKNCLAALGKFNMIRFWEHDINKNPNLVKSKLLKKIFLIESKINDKK